MFDYDLTVIGAGPGGYAAAVSAAKKGLRVAVIEKADAGGTCLNRGCIPAKSLLHSVHLYSAAKESDIFGVSGGDVTYDIGKIFARKDNVVRQLREGTEKILKSNGVTFIRGKASVKVVSVENQPGGDERRGCGGALSAPDGADLKRNNCKNPSAVLVETESEALELTTGNIIIATGSRPNRLPEHMQSLPGVFTSDEALTSNKALPKRVLILGGGVIGVEFAGFYNALGCRVTVADSMNLLLSRMDAEISKSLAKFLAKRGVNIITSAELKDISPSENGLICSFLHKNAVKETEAGGVLVSIGRAPVTDLVLPESGVLKDSRGFIVTDENMMTNVKGVYAIGDCVSGSVQLAHAASAQGLNAVSHITGDKPRADMDAIPSCIYSNPEIASVGLTQSEAESKGISVKIGKYSTSSNGKSIITGEERGFVKLVFDAGTGALIGAQLMCARATDIIDELTCAILNKNTAEEIARVIRPHPTYAEVITEAAETIL